MEHFELIGIKRFVYTNPQNEAYVALYYDEIVQERGIWVVVRHPMRADAIKRIAIHLDGPDFEALKFAAESLAPFANSLTLGLEMPGGGSGDVWLRRECAKIEEEWRAKITGRIT
jgi:hypothetical protein